MTVLHTIGWREWVGLPDLSVPAIKAKVDTGARTSCLHVFHYEEFMRDGGEWIRFRLHPLQKDTGKEIVCEAPLVDRRHVTDSGGHTELRPVIATSLALGGFSAEQGAARGDRKKSARGGFPLIIKNIEITLSNRETMLFRMLLGRTAMRGKLLVNPALSFTAGVPDVMTLRQHYPETSLS